MQEAVEMHLPELPDKTVWKVILQTAEGTVEETGKNSYLIPEKSIVILESESAEYE